MPNDVKLRTQFVLTGDPTTVNETTPYAPGQLGCVVLVKNTSAGVDPGQGSKTFRYVQVDSTATVAPFKGAVAWWSNKDTFLVTTNAANRGQVAGIFTSANPNLGNFGYIQIGGPAIVKFIDAVTSAPTAAGLHVIPSATNGKADCLASGSAPTFPLIGVSNAAYNAPLAEAEVMLRIADDGA